MFYQAALSENQENAFETDDYFVIEDAPEPYILSRLITPMDYIEMPLLIEQCYSV
jgi:hypothetical protein